MFKGSTLISLAFAQGKAKKAGENISTGNALYYFGNKIAEWRADGLYISNGGYTGRRGETGSKTTKDKLNSLPGVRISQNNFKWYLNGEEWGGEWVKVEGVAIPVIEKGKEGAVYDTTIKYHHSDGWRGYEYPEYAIAGANDTGMWSDSPCRTEVAEKELNEVTELLRAQQIPVKKITCQTSNVFCVHHYIVPMVKDVEKAKEVVKTYIETNSTQLIYAM